MGARQHAQGRRRPDRRGRMPDGRGHLGHRCTRGSSQTPAPGGLGTAGETRGTPEGIERQYRSGQSSGDGDRKSPPVRDHRESRGALFCSPINPVAMERRRTNPTATGGHVERSGVCARSDYRGSRRRGTVRVVPISGDRSARASSTSPQTTTSRPHRSAVRPRERSHWRATASETGSRCAARDTGLTAAVPRASRSAWRSLGIGHRLWRPESPAGEVRHQGGADHGGTGLTAGCGCVVNSVQECGRKAGSQEWGVGHLDLQ